MAITLSSDDYDDLWQQANPQNHTAKQGEEYEVQWQGHSERVSLVPEQLGSGYVQEIQLRGINLMLVNYQFHNDVCVKEKAQDTACIDREIGFNLSGNRNSMHTGESFILWGNNEDDAESTCVTFANAPIQKIDIHMESSEALVQMISETLDTLPKGVSQQITEENLLMETNAITPAMRATLEQIFYCPFQGKTKALYLEGKCLELIALRLEQLKKRDGKIKSYCALKPDDIERIHLAKTILTKDSEHPPSLMALARRVGLNDYKLKVGFRQVCGTTVFGYLHQHRMAEAHRLLTEQRMNVKEVAQAVGYANQSRFAAAFRKQFGVNPKAYLLSTRV